VDTTKTSDHEYTVIEQKALVVWPLLDLMVSSGGWLGVITSY
jgi:hypothetical protein